ncbi:unnamed protein product, partial [Amoebophrya sp. A25]
DTIAWTCCWPKATNSTGNRLIAFPTLRYENLGLLETPSDDHTTARGDHAGRGDDDKTRRRSSCNSSSKVALRAPASTEEVGGSSSSSSSYTRSKQVYSAIKSRRDYRTLGEFSGSTNNSSAGGASNEVDREDQISTRQSQILGVGGAGNLGGAVVAEDGGQTQLVGQPVQAIGSG